MMAGAASAAESDDQERYVNLDPATRQVTLRYRVRFKTDLI